MAIFGKPIPLFANSCLPIPVCRKQIAGVCRDIKVQKSPRRIILQQINENMSKKHKEMNEEIKDKYLVKLSCSLPIPVCHKQIAGVCRDYI